MTESWDSIPGYNLTGGTPDGRGAIHTRGGYVWELLKDLHRMYPSAPIQYMNMCIGGTNSGADISGDGRANALYPDRWNATKTLISDFTAIHGPGSVLYIPIDSMNENSDGGKSSMENWIELASGAQALGAVVHFMGNGRPDVRYVNRDQQMAVKCRQQVYAALETGSAVSDAWRLIAPDAIRGTMRLIEQEQMDATLQNHEGAPQQITIGRDAASNYL